MTDWKSAPKMPGEMFDQPKRQSNKGLNHGRKSSKVIQDCTICASCRSIVLGSIVSRCREKRNRLAGNNSMTMCFGRDPFSRVRKSENNVEPGRLPAVTMVNGPEAAGAWDRPRRTRNRPHARDLCSGRVPTATISTNRLSFFFPWRAPWRHAMALAASRRDLGSLAWSSFSKHRSRASLAHPW